MSWSRCWSPLVQNSTKAESRGTLESGSDAALTDDITIDRIRWTNSRRVRLWRTGAGHFADFFNGDGSDLTVTVQTVDDTIDLVVADTYTLMLESSVNFAVDDVAEQTILDGVSDGTRFILAIWRTTPVTPVGGDAGRAGWRTGARGAGGSAVAVTPVGGDAGRAGWRTGARGAGGSAVDLTPVGGDAGRAGWRTGARGASGSAVASVDTPRLLIVDNTSDELFELDPDGLDSEGTLLRGMPSGLTSPSAMTVHEGRLLVVEDAGDDLFELDPDGLGSEGTLLRSLPSSLTTPYGMTDLEGRLLIVDFVDDELWEIDPDGADDEGTLLRALPSGLTGPFSMTVYEGRVLIGDTTGDDLWEIDPDGADDEGTRLRILPSNLLAPYAMSVYDGRLLIADNSGDELWEINPDGADSEGTRLRALPNGLTAPYGMAVLPVAVAPVTPVGGDAGRAGWRTGARGATGTAVAVTPVGGDAGRAGWRTGARGAGGSAVDLTPVGGDAGRAGWRTGARMQEVAVAIAREVVARFMIQIDWADDAYLHAISDVTVLLEGLRIRYGNDIVVTENEPVLQFGEGRMQLRFNPVIFDSSVTPDQLRRVHRFRVTETKTGFLCYEGLLEFVEEFQAQLLDGDILTFDLHGLGWLKDGGVWTFPLGSEFGGSADLGQQTVAIERELDPANFVDAGTVSDEVPDETDVLSDGRPMWLSAGQAVVSVASFYVSTNYVLQDYLRIWPCAGRAQHDSAG